MKLLRNALLVLTLLITAASCKKDKAATPLGIGGEYAVVEIEQYNPPVTETLPNAKGEHGKFVIRTVGETEATITIQLFDKDNKAILDKTYDCLLKKDTDGDPFLSLKADNSNVAYFFDNELDFYAIPGFRIGGKR